LENDSSNSHIPKLKFYISNGIHDETTNELFGNDTENARKD
jgi:hypothetical protein